MKYTKDTYYHVIYGSIDPFLACCLEDSDKYITGKIVNFDGSTCPDQDLISFIEANLATEKEIAYFKYIQAGNKISFEQFIYKNEEYEIY